MIACDKGGGDFEQIEPGTHVARCVRLIDLGTEWNDMYKNERHQIYIGFETPNARMTWKDKDGNEHEGPFMVGMFQTLSLGEKSNLRPLLESWRGKEFTAEELSGFVMKNILGKPCMLNIIAKEKKGKKRSVISAIMPPMQGMDCPERENDLIYFSLAEFSQTEYDNVPEGYQKMIQRSHEWKKLNGEQQPTTSAVRDFDDDIPF